MRRTASLILGAAMLMGAETSCLGDLSVSDIITGHTAKITVENLSEEAAWVVVYTDDAYVGSKLGPFGQAGIETHVSGIYNVVVRPDSQNLAAYRDALFRLRQQTRELHLPFPGAPIATKQEIENTKLLLFNGLVLGTETLATCAGSITFPETVGPDPEPIRKQAIVSRSPDGSWSASCG